MPEPMIWELASPDAAGPLDADGASFGIHVWRGSGPARLHVHNADDEAWLVVAGALRFRFAARSVEAPAGSVVFVPAGVAHTFEALAGARYVLVLTPRLRRLVAELQATRDPAEQAAIYRRHESELLE